MLETYLFKSSKAFEKLWHERIIFKWKRYDYYVEDSQHRLRRR